MKKQLQDFISHPLFSGSIIMVIGSNSVNFLNYLYHLVMGRMLGPANYGELASLISLIGLLGIIPGSISLAIIKYVSSAKTAEEIASLVDWLKGKIFITSLIFFIILLIISPVVSSFLNIGKTSYLVLIAVSLLFSIQLLLNRAILQGLLKFKEMVLSALAENITKLLVSILLIYLGFQVNGALFAFVITTLLGWYITNFYLRLSSSGSKSSMLFNIKPMLIFTIPVLIQSVSTTSLYSSDVILVKHFFSSYDTGIYASLSTLGKIIFFATGPISTVMFPLVSKRKARGEPYRKIFIYSFIATAIFAGVSLIIYWLFPELVIRLLYGTAYLEAKGLVVWFGIFISLFTLSSLLINYSLSLGRSKVTLFPMAAAVVQIIMIILFHQTLFNVILISTIVTALLLISLLIYSSYEKRPFL